MIKIPADITTDREKSDLRILRLLAVVFALTSGILSWTGFQQIYGEPEGSNLLPSVLTRIWPALTLLILSFVAVPATAWAYRRSALPLRAMPWLKQHHRIGLFCLVVVVVLGLAIGVISLRAFPNSGDENDYLFQAETFRAGRLSNPPPPIADVFTVKHITEKDGKWVSLFFPGWPLILAAFTSLGLAGFIVSPVLALLLMLAFAHLSRLLTGPGAALLSAALLSCCPFFLLNGASYFAHVPTALFAVLFVVALVRFLATGSATWALSAGATLGFVGLIRPFTVIPLAIPCGVEVLLRAERRHYWRMPLILLGSLPFLLALLLYDNAITRNPWLTVETWTLPQLHIGLHPIDEDGTYVSLKTTSLMAVSHLIDLAEWTSPLLCLLYLAAGLWKCWQRRLAFYDFIFPILVASYIFFPNWGGNQYGPRYYFDAFPFLVLTVASAAAKWFSEQRRAGVLPAAATAALSGSVIMAGAAYPALAYQFHRIVDERMELYDVVAKARLRNAVVVIGDCTGSAFPLWMCPDDLSRNGVDFSSSVLYARDVPEKMCELARTFPGRSFYRYKAEGGRYPGQLWEILPCPPAQQTSHPAH